MVKKITFLVKVILLILIGYTFSYAIDLKIVPLKKPILEKEIKEKKISKILVIISNQEKVIIQSILTQLKKSGLKKKQIVNKKFHELV